MARALDAKKNSVSLDSIRQSKKIKKMMLNNHTKRRDLVYQALSPTHSRRIEQHRFKSLQVEEESHGFEDDLQPKSRLEKTVLLLEGSRQHGS